MTNEEQELAAIACGKRSAEDQTLWDKVAVECYADNVNRGLGIVQASRDAFNSADAFMAERAKRLAAKQ